MRTILLTTALAAGLAAPVAAETFEITAYTGVQSAPHSRARGDYPNGGSFDELVGWEGRSGAMPPYWGLRGTWWRSETSGIALEFTHTKVYADDTSKQDLNFSEFEFSDGHNILTVNYVRRWPEVMARTSAFAAVGAGIAVPHVEVTHPDSGSETFGYQYTGPALRLAAGLSYDLTESWALVGEYQFIISDNTADLDDGGELETVIKTNALNFGVSYKF